MWQGIHALGFLVLLARLYVWWFGTRLPILFPFVHKDQEIEKMTDRSISGWRYWQIVFINGYLRHTDYDPFPYFHIPVMLFLTSYCTVHHYLLCPLLNLPMAAIV
jgi:hypothetical protein